MSAQSAARLAEVLSSRISSSRSSVVTLAAASPSARSVAARLNTGSIASVAFANAPACPLASTSLSGSLSLAHPIRSSNSHKSLRSRLHRRQSCVLSIALDTSVTQSKMPSRTSANAETGISSVVGAGRSVRLLRKRSIVAACVAAHARPSADSIVSCSGAHSHCSASYFNASIIAASTASVSGCCSERDAQPITSSARRACSRRRRTPAQLARVFGSLDGMSSHARSRSA
jgi:hypothetical protein